MLIRSVRALVAAVVLGCVAGVGAEPALSQSARAAALPAVQTVAPSRAVAVNDDPARTLVLQRLANMNPREKAASLLMVHVPGTDGKKIARVVERKGLAGVILMGDNVPQPDSGLARITDALHADPVLPPLIAIDQEGGIVRRVDSDSAPAAASLRSMPPAAATQAFIDRSALLAGLGVNVNFGIVADATGQRDSFIRPRTLGDAPGEAAPRVAAAVEGERGRVLSTLKHFPGHGVAPGDSHSSIPGTDMDYDRWRATHAVPFEAGIDAGAELVMFGHLRFDAIDPVPASLSCRWHDILRDDLGFDGVAVTDDLSMLQHSGERKFRNAVKNAVRALECGNDVLLYVGPVDIDDAVDAMVDAVKSGRIPPERLDEAALRVLTLRHSLAG